MTPAFRRALAAILLALAPAQAQAQAEPKKNVLFIVADDQSTDLGCYGNALVQSPNIDRLAAMGTRFDRAYCQSPFCGPSRASLLTGLRPDSTRVFDLQSNVLKTRPEAITLPSLFRRAGYATARAGKIFHQGVGPPWLGVDGPDDPGAWDERINPNWTAAIKAGPNVNLTPGVHGGSAFNIMEAGRDEDHPDGQSAAFIVEKLRQRARDKKPFFLAAGFYMPHVPLWAPRPYFDLYPLDRIRLASNASRANVPDAAFTHAPDMGMSEEQRKQAVRAYYAATSFMDAQVGKLLDALEETGLKENTLVIFWSDHGFHLGSHGQWSKQTLFEDAARAPLIIFDPSQKKRGGVVASPVELLDVYPTLVEACGLPAPPQVLEGKSLRPLLDDPTLPHKDAAWTQIERGPADAKCMGRSVRTSRFRYTEWDGGRAGAELYDHEADPLEARNLAGDAQFAPAVAEMKRKLQAGP